MRGKAPTLELDLTDYGYRYAGVRTLDEADLYVRGYHFVMPFTQIRPVAHADGRSSARGRPHLGADGRRDTMVWNWQYSYGDEPLTEEDRLERRRATAAATSTRRPSAHGATRTTTT